jgi:uncharacterized damage-inducible protein DinB
MPSLAAYHRSYARHNHWANEQILDAILKLPGDQYYKPILPKTRSIHELLNHVLVMDKLWLAELEGRDIGITSGMQMLHEDRDAYVADRRATDLALIAATDARTDADLEAILYCDEPVDGLSEWPLMYEVAHVFRHQVHHRGQVTVLLQQTDVGAPKIDGLFVPEPAEASAITEAAE